MTIVITEYPTNVVNPLFLCILYADPEETVRLSMSNKSTKSSNSYKSNRGDFVTVYATVPGCFAFRDTSKGTWFIMCLVEALRKYSADQ